MRARARAHRSLRSKIKAKGKGNEGGLDIQGVRVGDWDLPRTLPGSWILDPESGGLFLDRSQIMVSTICEGGWLRFRGEREQKGSSLQSDNEVRRKGGKKRGEED